MLAEGILHIFEIYTYSNNSVTCGVAPGSSPVQIAANKLHFSSDGYATVLMVLVVRMGWRLTFDILGSGPIIRWT